MKTTGPAESDSRELQIALDSLTAARDRTTALEQIVATDRKHHAALEVLLIGRQAAEADIRKRLRKSEAARELLRTEVARLAAELAAVGTDRDTISAQISEFHSEAALAGDQRDVALAEAALLREKCEKLRRESSEARAFAKQSWLAAQKVTAIIDSVLGERSDFLQMVAQRLGLRRWKRIRERLADATQVLTAQPPNAFAARGTLAYQQAPQPGVAQMSGRNPYIRAESLAELLSLQDADFVRCAYVTLLGRQPEPDGEAAYLGRLRDGYSKLTIAAQLRFSDEGRRHDPGIAGLDRQLRRHRNATRLLTGWFLRAATGREGDTRSERANRRLQAQIRQSEDKQVHLALGYADMIRELQRDLSAINKNVEIKSASTCEHLQGIASLISPVQKATKDIQSMQLQIESRLDDLSLTVRDIECELVEAKQPCTIEDILQEFGTDVDG